MPFVETDCTVEHEGKKFTAGGAYVTPDAALVYIGHNGLNAYRSTDWHGNLLGEVLSHRVGRDRCTPSGGRYRMAYVRVRLDGREWHGRYNFDWSQACRLRPVAR